MIQKERNRAGRSGTLMKSVYHSLKEDICNGVIKTGELLSEAQLAEPGSASAAPPCGRPWPPWRTRAWWTSAGASGPASSPSPPVTCFIFTSCGRY